MRALSRTKEGVKPFCNNPILPSTIKAFQNKILIMTAGRGYFKNGMGMTSFVVKNVFLIREYFALAF